MFESIVILVGWLNWAKLAVAFKNPAVPLPATVEIFPDWSILRILWFSLSATYTLPLESTIVPYG